MCLCLCVSVCVCLCVCVWREGRGVVACVHARFGPFMSCCKVHILSFVAFWWLLCPLPLTEDYPCEIGLHVHVILPLLPLILDIDYIGQVGYVNHPWGVGMHICHLALVTVDRDLGNLNSRKKVIAGTYWPILGGAGGGEAIVIFWMTGLVAPLIQRCNLNRQIIWKPLTGSDSFTKSGLVNVLVYLTVETMAL